MQGVESPGVVSENDHGRERSDGVDEGAESTSNGQTIDAVCPVMTAPQFKGLELAGSVNEIPVCAFVDSGSTSNYISQDFADKLGLSYSGAQKTLQLADGSEHKTAGSLRRLQFQCGRVKMRLDVDVFDKLSHELLLGLPWLIQENPRIDFSRGIVTVHRQSGEIELPTRQLRHRHDHLRSGVDQSLSDVDGRSMRLMGDVDHRSTGSVMQIVTTKTILRSIKKHPDQGALMVVVQPAEKGKSAVETIPDEHQGDDVDKLIRSDLDPQLADVLREHRHVFAKDLPSGIPPARRGHEFRIELEEGTEPIHRPLYKLSPMELEEVKRQIDYLLEKGFIRPSESPFGAPILFVPKKDGGLRMCLDYRWLNRATIKNRYPLPLPEEMIDRLHAARVFSKIDLRSGYWQMPVRESDVHKTAFRSRFGHFECCVLPFGLCNAPAQFMAMMNDLFSDMLDKSVIIFLDDILIFSPTIQDHIQHLQAVLRRLTDHNLFAKASKCEIAQQVTEFVGHVVTEEGISPMDSKIKAINEWSTLDSVTDVRSFLGMASFYRKFIPGFAKICGPLHDLTKKGVKFEFGDKERQAMEAIKQRLTSSPVLILPDPLREYTVVTDASQDAIGGVLCQDHGSGLQPIAFMSKRLTASEKKYSAYERELAAAAIALRQWRHYVEGCPGGVVLMTDHQPLTHLMSQSVLSRVQSRWIKTGYFQSIHPKITYVPGKSNVVADALSRCQKVSDGERMIVESLDSISIAATIDRDADSLESWIEALYRDDRSRAIIDRLNDGQAIEGYRLDDGILRFRHHKSLTWKIVVPEQFQASIIRSKHDVPIAGHVGMLRTMELIDRDYWWKGMREDVRSFVRSCPSCQMMKSESGPSKGLLQPIPIPTHKWQQMTTDLVTDLPESHGFTAVAVFVDRLTKMVKFVPCTKEITAVDYAKAFFQHVFRSFGCPETIISDRDPRFLSRFWREVFKLVGTELRFSTSYHPETDGQSEVTIRTLENFLRPYVEDRPERWSELLPQLEFAANNAINTSTGYSPFFLAFGQHPRVPDLFNLGSRKPKSEVESVDAMVRRMQDDVKDAIRRYDQAQDTMLRHANKRRRHEEFEIGDSVMTKSQFLPHLSRQNLPAKLRRRFTGPFKIINKVSPVAYTLELPVHWKIHPTLHVSKLRRFHSESRFFEEVQPPQPEVVRGELEYEVEQILRHRGTERRREYLVLWKGYPLHEATWEPEANLTNCSDILVQYRERAHLQ